MLQLSPIHIKEYLQQIEFGFTFLLWLLLFEIIWLDLAQKKKKKKKKKVNKLHLIT